MSSTINTNNPLILNLTSNIIVTPQFKPNVRTGSITYKQTYGGTNTVSFTVPAHITRIKCAFTWHYHGDERPRLSRGLRSIGSGCGIWDVTSNKNIPWHYYNRDNIIAVTPKKTYTLKWWVDGYKGRDYGFILSWSPDINSLTANTNDL